MKQLIVIGPTAIPYLKEEEHWVVGPKVVAEYSPGIKRYVIKAEDNKLLYQESRGLILEDTVVVHPEHIVSLEKLD